jgi:hypothetical protein
MSTEAITQAQQAITAAKRERLSELTSQIHEIGKRTLKAAWGLGELLSEVKDNALWEFSDDGFAGFYDWAEVEFNFSDSTVRDLITLSQTYTRDDIQNTRLQFTGLLAIEKIAAKVPEDVRDEVRKQAIEDVDSAGPPEKKAKTREAIKAVKARVRKLSKAVDVTPTAKDKRAVDDLPWSQPEGFVTDLSPPEDATQLRALPPTGGETVHLDCTVPVQFSPVLVNPKTGKPARRIETVEGVPKLDGLLLHVLLGDKMLVIELGKKPRGWIADE